MKKYFFGEFEDKWRAIWQKENLYSFKLDQAKKKFYTLVEFPYTSGDLHIGHWFAFTTPDVVSRFARMNGKNVFFPIGFDAFGLPAENAAIKRAVHPQDWTMKNIEVMTRQFHSMGTMLNWESLIITCQPEYYHWNQWIFLQFFKKGLAYRGKAMSNWCQHDQTVLANENVEEGKCWRCGNPVIQKEIEQWFLKITDYADRLVWPLNSVKNKSNLDWPKSVKVGQNNWIGRKEGIVISYKLSDLSYEIKCFTTTPVNFGATFIVVAPEHELVSKILSGEIKIPQDKLTSIKKYVAKSLAKTQEQRLIEQKDKTGVFTGLYALNHVTKKEIPIWISDFVLSSVGTGAIQGCPGHDKRDFAFAKKFDLPIVRVVTGPGDETGPIENENDVIVSGGVMINSDFLNGIKFAEAMKKTMDYFEEKGWGKRTVTYHLRDWSISRQRYWGTPVPIIHCSACGMIPVPEADLPVELPYEVDFTPHGLPPLASNKDWLNVKCPKCGGEAKRDAETLDTFFDSSWYFWRYLDPHYKKGPFDRELAKKLTPVDIYFGGGEHTLGHTLYARFFTQFFHDLGLVDYDEFALKRVQHGVVLGPDGNRMSKSRGNVINPDMVVAKYGADTARLYLCFMMPYDATAAWSDGAIAGVHRFLLRIWRLFESYKNNKTIIEEPKVAAKLQKTIYKVNREIERLKLNTAIAAMMEFINDWEKTPALSVDNAKKFLQILSPFAPFFAEEIWRENLGEKQSIHLSLWPASEAVIEKEVIIPVQINGKLRGVINISHNIIDDKERIEKLAMENDNINKHLQGQNFKAIYVPGKILNFVGE